MSESQIFRCAAILLIFREMKGFFCCIETFIAKKAFIALIIEIVTERPLATEVNNFHIKQMTYQS